MFLLVNHLIEKLYRLKKRICNTYRILFTLTFLWLQVSLSAQSDSSTTFNFDVHAGITASQVQGDGVSGFNKLGAIGGIGVSTVINEKWEAAAELNFMQKGSVKRPDAEAGDYTEYKMSLSYAQIPVLIRYRLHPKFHLSAGPALGKLLSSKEEDRDGVIQANVDFEEWELSALLGAGYKFSDNLAVHIRLDSSILPIRKKETDGHNQLKGRQYNSSLALFISYSIR